MGNRMYSGKRLIITIIIIIIIIGYSCAIQWFRLWCIYLHGKTFIICIKCLCDLLFQYARHLARNKLFNFSQVREKKERQRERERNFIGFFIG